MVQARLQGFRNQLLNWASKVLGLVRKERCPETQQTPLAPYKLTGIGFAIRSRTLIVYINTTWESIMHEKHA